MNITCAHCGQSKPRKEMFRNGDNRDGEDSLNYPGKWVCMDTIRCADARYDRDKKRGLFR